MLGGSQSAYIRRYNSDVMAVKSFIKNNMVEGLDSLKNMLILSMQPLFTSVREMNEVLAVTLHHKRGNDKSGEWRKYILSCSS
jgi:hypothetical protein